MSEYDPFARGPFAVSERTVSAPDQSRNRVFQCEIWSPARAQPPPFRSPLVIFSHYSGGGRLVSSFLCEHLASHGYVVAALDHSEVVAPELAPGKAETPAERAARIDAIIASRVPDIQFLIRFLLSARLISPDIPDFNPDQVGLTGHSFGGWTVLAAPDSEPRVRAVVALAPGGGSDPKPGILPVTLSFNWRRIVPTLYLAAADDVMIPLAGVTELFERTPSAKRMFVLANADHQHFVDDVLGAHEALRAMSFPPEAAWIPAAMRPAAELAPAEHAHLFVRGLTLAHLDAELRGHVAAGRFLAHDAIAALAARGVAATRIPVTPKS